MSDHGTDVRETDAYILDVVDSARQYMRELRAENEALRALVQSLRSNGERLGEEVVRAQLRLGQDLSQLSGPDQEQRLLELIAALRAELDEHRAQREALARRMAEVEAQSRRTAAQYQEIEQQYSNLSNLYVASYRLHETVERDEVLAIMQEIIVNIIGSEELAIFELTRDGKSLALVSSLGLETSQFERVSLETGSIGRAARTGKPYIAGAEHVVGAPDCERHLTACIPLKLGERVIGAIGIFRLLKQKGQLTGVDHELFDLLATHAATALYCTRLHATAGVEVELGVG